MRDANPICTLGDYSKPSHEGYRNTIELPVGNNLVPLRPDTIRLVQNRCLFHEIWSKDPNQHLKDFLKLVDSLELDGENREKRRLCLFQFSLCDQASSWLYHLPAGSITMWKDLTTRFLAKLRNDILMFQQHQREPLSEAWTRFKDLLQKFPHHGIDIWLQVQIFYDHVNPVTRRTIDQSAGGKLRYRNAKESWAFTSDCCLIELKNQVQRLMEAHLAPTQPTQVNKITTSFEICSGPHDTQYCSGPHDTQKCRRILGIVSVPSDTVKNTKLNINTITVVVSARSYPTENPQCSTPIYGLINAIIIRSKRQSGSHDDEPAESEEEEKDSLENTNTNPSASPDPSDSFITEKIASRKERVPETYDYRSQYDAYEYDTYHANYNIEMKDYTMYRESNKEANQRYKASFVAHDASFVALETHVDRLLEQLNKDETYEPQGITILDFDDEDEDEGEEQNEEFTLHSTNTMEYLTFGSYKDKENVDDHNNSFEDLISPIKEHDKESAPFKVGEEVMEANTTPYLPTLEEPILSPIDDIRSKEDEEFLALYLYEDKCSNLLDEAEVTPI
nr:zinc finger, CCHC-type [Tanacetum cinerariifolium]